MVCRNSLEKRKVLMKILLYIQGPLSCLNQFLASENPFKMMKNAFYFFVLKKSKFLPEFFGHVRKRFDKKA